MSVMRRVLGGPAALVLLAACAHTEGAPDTLAEAASEPGGGIAIINARAYTVADAGVIENATIVIDGGRIAAVGAGLAPPPGIEVIDAQGMRVTPGLLSSATQLGLLEVSSAQDTVDRSESAGTLGASFDVRYGLNFNSTLIPIARADGLTHGVIVPSASAQAPFAGSGAFVKLESSAEFLERPGIAMYANLDSSSTSAAGRSRSANWIVLRHALRLAREVGSSRAAASSLDDALEQADVAALLPVLSGDMPLVIRARREADIRQAVALGEEFGIRVVLYDANEAWRAADLLAAHDIPIILDPTDNLPSSFDEIGSRLDNAALLHAAGVRLGLYVSELQMSYNAGLELRQVAGLAVANGLPWDAALEALTAGAARIWGVEEHVGSLVPGKAGDLVIWSGDPFEVTTAPVAVLIDGRRVSLDNRQKQLRDRYSPVSAGSPPLQDRQVP